MIRKPKGEKFTVQRMKLGQILIFRSRQERVDQVVDIIDSLQHRVTFAMLSQIIDFDASHCRHSILSHSTSEHHNRNR
jgi:hypothetical protein